MKTLWNLLWVSLGIIFILVGLFNLINFYSDNMYTYYHKSDYYIVQIYNLLKIIAGATLCNIASKDFTKELIKYFKTDNFNKDQY